MKKKNPTTRTNSSPRICDICRDDGLCRNNENSPYYDERLFGETDYLDCIIYYKTIRVK